MTARRSALFEGITVALCAVGILWAARDAYAAAAHHCPTIINWQTGAFTCNGNCLSGEGTCDVPGATSFTAPTVQQWGWTQNGWVKVGAPQQNKTAKSCACWHTAQDEQGNPVYVANYDTGTCCNAVLFDVGYARIGTVGGCVPGCPATTGNCTLTGPITAAVAICTLGG